VLAVLWEVKDRLVDWDLPVRRDVLVVVDLLALLASPASAELPVHINQFIILHLLGLPPSRSLCDTQRLFISLPVCWLRTKKKQNPRLFNMNTTNDLLIKTINNMTID